MSSCTTCAGNRIASDCSCPTGFYESSCLTKSVCPACHSSCSTCTGPAETDCTSCATGKLKIIEDGGLSFRCITECPE